MKSKIILTSVLFGNLFFLLFSCQHKDVQENTVNLNAEKNIYPLFIIDEYNNNDYYLDNNHAKCLVSITNQVFVDNKLYGSFENVNKAVKFARDQNKKNVDQITTIAIKKNNGDYENVWKFSNSIGIEIDPKCKGCYSVYDLKISVDEAYVKYKNRFRSGIKIIFQESDDSDGSRTFILNFIKNKDWELAYREKIDTHLNAEDHYCRDSTALHNPKKELPILIILPNIQVFDSKDCK